LHLTASEIAALSGISEPTARSMLRTGKLPQMARCVRGVELLAQRAAVARSRSELGLLST
jgi:hypothetical protein